MAGDGYLLEIAGLPWALASQLNAPVQFGQTVYPYIFQLPTSAPIRTDLVYGTSETGGCTFWALNVENSISSNFFQPLRREPLTRMTSDLIMGAVTIDVENESAFDTASVQYVFLGQETLEIASYSPNQMNVLARGMFGTEDVDHQQYSAVDGGLYPLVYGFPPSLRGRRCWLWHYDFDDPVGSKVQMAAGYLQRAQWHSDGSFEFSIHSLQQRIQDSQVLVAPYARGKLRFDENTNVIAVDGLEVELEDPDISFPQGSANVLTRYISLTASDGSVELIGYRRTKERFITTTTKLGSAGKILTVNSTVDMQVGDTIELSTTPVQRNQIKQIVSLDTLLCTNELSPVPAPAIDVDVISRMQILPPLTRGGAGVIDNMKRLPLENGLKVEEVRVLQGDQIEIFFQLLLSREGFGVNSQYDVLPSGWGAGFPQLEVDLASFDELKERTSSRRYLFTEPFKLSDMLGWLMRSIGAYIFTDRSGKVRARLARVLYPDDQAALSIDIGNIMDQNLVELDGTEDMIRNYWQWGMDRPFLDQSGEPRVLYRMQQADSVGLYGQLALDDLGDPGITKDSQMQASAVAEMLWSRISRIQPRAKLELPFREGMSIIPRDYLKLTWSFMPDYKGGAGVTEQLFEVAVVEPRDNSNAVYVEAVQLEQGPYGLICPAGRVQAFTNPGGAGDITFEAGTDLSQAGTEDSDHWQVGDTVRIYDYSTFGTGLVVSATAQITSVNYPGRTHGLNVVPPWIGAGDLIVPGDFSTWLTRETSPQIEPVFLWQVGHVFASDENASPPTIDGSSKFNYGG